MFESPLTDDEQYWAGLLHADGSYSRNSIRLIQKDREVLVAFLRFLSQDSKITTAVRPTNFSPMAEVNMSSTSQGVANLRTLGVKAWPCGELTESRHFWRGVVDGDGSVYINGRGYPVVSLCSGEPQDVMSFSSWVGRLFDYPGPKPGRGSRGGWYATVGGGKARALGLFLYQDGFSAVTRKRDVALSFEHGSRPTRTPLLT